MGRSAPSTAFPSAAASTRAARTARAARVALTALTALAALSALACSSRALAQEASLGARARIEAPVSAPEDVVQGREVLTLRSQLGESFAPAMTLPGVVPVFSGVPYMMVRGAPPASTLELYDGVPVPAFHHVALGPPIAHLSLVSAVRFHRGVAPARYGRRLGAVLAYDAPDVPPDATQSEAVLSGIESQALLRTPGALSIAAHARGGYPGLLLEALGSDVALYYGDYQLRLHTALNPGTTATLHVFGAADTLGVRSRPDDDIALQFHRVLTRLTHRRRGLEVSAQLYAGYEQGALGAELLARTLRVGPSVYVSHEPDADSRVRLGADMEGRLTSLRRGAPGASTSSDSGSGNPNDRYLPDLDGGFDFTKGPVDFVDQSSLANHPARSAFGAYAELELLRRGVVGIETGLRVDAWSFYRGPEHSTDPRATVRLRPHERLHVHASAGTAHQSAASPLPIPGIADIELDAGLQRAIQTEAGVRVLDVGGLELGVTGFYNRFDRLVFLEVVLDCEGNSSPLARDPRMDIERICESPGLPRADGDAHGLELLAATRSGSRLTGWLSYTLGYASARSEDGTRFTPQFDVRHLASLVLGYDFGGGWRAGTRLQYRSGKPAVNTVYDFVQGNFERIETRLPGFFRADVNVEYGFATGFGRMALFAAMQNLTFSREATKQDCRFDGTFEVRCTIDYQPAIVLPNVGVRGEL